MHAIKFKPRLIHILLIMKTATEYLYEFLSSTDSKEETISETDLQATTYSSRVKKKRNQQSVSEEIKSEWTT